MKVKFHLKAEKKHSVRYDADDEDDALSSVYIMKTHIPKPYPQVIFVTLEFQDAAD